MKHADFHLMYKEIRDKEVVALRNALQRFPMHKYDWEKENQTLPRVIASPKHCDFASDYEVCRITDNLGYDCGIFLKDWETGRELETGFSYLAFGSIDYLLDKLPEIGE